MIQQAPSRVLVVGSINEDLVLSVPRLPLAGETLEATSVATFGGGKGANQAVACQLAGGSVAFVGSVGTDQGAERLVTELRSFGVDTRWLSTVPGPSGTATITVSADGTNSIVIFPGANAELRSIHHVYGGDQQPDFAVVLTQGEIPTAGIIEAADLARRLNARFVLNLAPFKRVPERIIAAADPLILNETEVAELLDAAPATTIEEGLAQATRAHDRFGCAVVVTLGSRGAVLADGEGGSPFPPVPTDTVVDTTGAGDAFTGALCALLARGENLRSACRAGIAAGSLAVRRHGARSSFATIESIEALLATAHSRDGASIPAAISQNAI